MQILLLLAAASFVSAFVPVRPPCRTSLQPLYGKPSNRGSNGKATGRAALKKVGGGERATRKTTAKAKSGKDSQAVSKRGDARGARSFKRQTLQRSNDWDVIEKQRVPLSSLLIGGGVATAVGSYFFNQWYAKRADKLVADFVDDMMVAGTDKKELYQVVVRYKGKLGPFATTRMLNEYLKAVFRAPDLSSSFVDSLNSVVNSLLPVKHDELMTMIAGISNEMAKAQEFVGMSILLFVFERVLPADVAAVRLEPLRRALGKALPGNVADNMAELARDAYSLEVETLFSRGESPLVPPDGYDVLGLRDEDAQAVFKRVKANYEGVGYEGGEGEGLEDLSQSLIVKRKEPLHDMIYGTAEEIAEKFISGYKEEKERKKADAARGRPPTVNETVQRISAMVLSKEGEDLIAGLQRFECARCRRTTTLMPGQLEEDLFGADYACPGCGAGRDMVLRKA